jgi:hypothetical protein
MAYQVEFIARLKDEVTGKLKGMSGAVKEFQSNLKAGFVDGIRSALPDQLSFIADKMEALPIGALAVGGAFAAVGSAAVQMAQQVTDTALAFDKLSSKTGASVEFLSTFTAIAADADVSAEQVATAMQLLSRNLAETGNTTQTVEAEMLALADLFQTMPDGPQKTAIAMQAFGRAGAEMIPILNQGSEALRNNMQAMTDMGRVITSDTVAAANRFDDAMDALGGRLEGLRNTIGGAVLPVLVDLASGLDSVATGFTLAGDAIAQLTTQGQINTATMAGLRAAHYDVMLAVSYLNPAMAGLRGTFMAQRDAALQQAEAMQTTKGAASGATSALAAMGPVAMRSAGQARSAAAIFYAAAGSFVEGVKLMDSARASTARYAGMATNIQYEQKLAETRRQSAAAARYSAMATAEVTKATYGDRDAKIGSTQANTELNSSIDSINAGLDRSMGLFAGGGGAAGGMKAEVEELNASLQELEERQKTIGGYLGSNTAEMTALQKVQTAYSIATGQLSQDQFAQEQAVKSVVQALADKRINEEQAVTTAMSLAQGYVSASEAMQVAGESGKRFYDETAGVLAIAQNAKSKVSEMGEAMKALPDSKNVDVVATILGMQELREAKDIVEKLDLHERHTITYNVVYRVSQTGVPPPGAPPPGTDPDSFNNSGGGGGGSGAPGAASGGPVRAGQAYRIGEQGPELFVPASNGYIVPNHNTGSGNEQPINVTLMLDGATVARVVAKHMKRG